MIKWLVKTELGSVETWAATKKRAIRNAKYRVVMYKRNYRDPKPQDLAHMRDLEIYSCEAAETE